MSATPITKNDVRRAVEIAAESLREPLDALIDRVAAIEDHFARSQQLGEED